MPGKIHTEKSIKRCILEDVIKEVMNDLSIKTTHC